MTTEIKPKTTRARKSKNENKAANLIAALKYVGQILHKKDNPFCLIQDGWLYTKNETVNIGTKIEEDLNCIPNLFQLLDALQKCKHEITIVQMSEWELSVKSGNFEAIVNCKDFGSICKPVINEPCAVLDNGIKTALDNVYGILVDKHENKICENVHVKSGSMITTNKFAILEYWHGVNLPEMLLPKIAAKVICKSDKELTGMGYDGGQSVTFYFKDESYVHSTLTYPDENDFKIMAKIQGYLNRADLNFWGIPENFFLAAKNVASFNENHVIYFDENGISNLNKEGFNKTSFKVEGLPTGMAFNARLLLSVQHAMSKAHFEQEEGLCYFIGQENKIRGLVNGWKDDSSYNQDVPYVRETNPTDFNDVDLPF